MVNDTTIKEIKITTDYIQLQQCLKLVGLISMGAEAKYFLSTNQVYVNNTLEDRRGRKIYKGDIIRVNKMLIKIT